MLKHHGNDAVKQALPSPIRMQGDGMENEADIKNETVHHVKRDKSSLGNQLIYRAPDFKHFTPTPPVITGKIVNLVPKNVTQTKKDKILLGTLKGKEPKFVPYEPYKAAVKPIIPYEKKGKPGERKLSQKPVDLKLMPTDVSSVQDGTKKHEESSKETADEGQNDVALQERKAMEDEIKTLKEENGQLESQLKFQAQVNGELKNLLVAAMGEDLETRVHLLTEDKLQLARALLNSAQRLSTHQEQTEWLAGQCEVWRSKFLASRNLSVLRENFDHTYSISHKPDVASTNILDLAAGTARLSEGLWHTLLGGSNTRARAEPDFTGLSMSTCAEKAAENLLANPMPLLLSEAACSAVVGAAVAVGGQMLIRSPLPACCGHCSGDIKLI